MTIMDALYRGQFRPIEQVTPQSPECRKANREIARMRKKIHHQMRREDYALVEELVNLISVAQVLENQEAYKNGFAAGLLLMQEAQQMMAHATEG